MSFSVSDISDTFGSGGANIAPGQGIPNLRDILRDLLSRSAAPVANVAALQATLAANRVAGQEILTLDTSTTWVWKPADTTAVDSTHVAPTDVGGGAGRWVAAGGGGSVRTVVYLDSTNHPAGGVGNMIADYNAVPTDALVLVDLSAIAGGRDGPSIYLATPVEDDFPVTVRNIGGDSTVDNWAVWASAGTTIEDLGTPGSFGPNTSIYANPIDGGTWVLDRVRNRWILQDRFFTPGFTPALSSGSGTLVNGVSVAIGANITPSSKVVVTRNGLAASTAIGELIVGSRANGTPGHFVVTSEKDDTSGVQTGDQSTFDWFVIG
jgi:hypothetical protein